ncbi:MAG: YggT family protein [Gammaproteobacteria bacterium]|nr:YggT family protein [Gammaproteobacteria bacterium]
MNGYLATPLAFLINTLFQLYIIAVLLRFLLQWARASFYNPLSQFLVKVTNPALKPLRRIIPGLAGLDLAAVVLMLVLQMVALGLIAALNGFAIGPGTLFLLAVAELVELTVYVFIFSILIEALLSWVNPGRYNPMADALHSLNDPILRPIRRVVPPVSGFDLSPLVAIIGLQVLLMLIMPPLRGLAG